MITTEASSRWRFVSGDDMTALYRLLIETEPLWWRVARGGLSPAAVMANASVYNGLLVVLANDVIVGVIGVAEMSTSGISATIDIVARPGNEEDVRSAVPSIIMSLFRSTSLVHLHYERFATEPHLLGAIEPVWEREVTFPEFALVNGKYTDRLVFGARRVDCETWLADYPRVAAQIKNLEPVTS